MDQNIQNRGDYREALLSGSHIKVGSVWADGHTSVGTLNARGDTLLEGNLRVKQTSSLEGHVTMSKNLGVKGAVRITGSSGETYVSGSQTITAPGLAVSGTSVLADNVEALRDVYVGGGPNKTGGKLYVSGTSYFTGSMQISSALAVTGSARFGSNVFITNSLVVSKSIRGLELYITSSSNTYDLTVRNTASIHSASIEILTVTGSGTASRFRGSVAIEENAEISGTLKVDKDTEISGNLDVQKDVTVTQSLHVKQNAAISGTVRIGGDLYVTGSTTISQSLNVYKLFVTTSGQIGTDLAVSGNALVLNSMSVSGNAVVNKDLWVKRNVQVDGNLYVSGTITKIGTEDLVIKDKYIEIASGSPTPEAADGAGVYISGANVWITHSTSDNQIQINEGIRADGDSNISGNLRIEDPHNKLVVDGTGSFGNLEVSRSASIDGNTNIKGNLAVTGSTNLKGATTIGGKTQINNNLQVRDSASISGSLSVGGTASVVGSISTQNSITASGDISSSNWGYFRDLNVSRSITAQNLTVSKTGSIQRLVVQDSASILGSASIGKELDVKGNTHLYQNLQIDGSCSFSGPISASGAISASSFYGDGRELYNVTCAIATASATTANFIAAAGEEVDFKHKFHSDNVTVTVYQTITSSAGREIIQITPAKVQLIDGDTARVKFADAAEGYAVITDAGHLVTASAGIQEVTTFSASYTATAGEIKQFEHRLGTTNVICAVYAKNGSLTEQIVPDSLRIASANRVAVRFAEAATGYVVIAKAGQVINTTTLEETATYTASFDANSGSVLQFRHNFATENVLVQVWKSVKNYGPGTLEELHPTITSYIPAKIQVTSPDTVEVTFAERVEGYVVIGKAGHLVNGYDDLEAKNVHYGTTGSWSAKEYETDFLEVNNSASITRLVVPKEGFIDAYKIGNRTADQGYTPYGQGMRDWNTYTIYETNSIDQYISDAANVEPKKVSTIDGRGDLTIKGDLITNHIFNTSDEELKYNIFTLPNGLENVAKLRGVTFRWNEDARPDLGVIAQEVQGVYPELVREVGGCLRVNETGLIAPLIEAVKTLKRTTEILEEKIKNLETRVEGLENLLQE